MRNISLIILLLFILPITAIANGPGGSKKNAKVDIKPTDVIEKCLKMKPDQVLDYAFEASKPLAFNLHYHLLDGTVFHIKEETAKRKEIFHPVKDQNVYCMAWKNSGQDTVTLDYRYSVEDK